MHSSCLTFIFLIKNFIITLLNPSLNTHKQGWNACTTWKTMVLQPLTPFQHLSHIVLTSSVFQSQLGTAGVVPWIMNYTQLHLFSFMKYFSQRGTMRVNLIEALMDINLISGRTAWFRSSFTETNCTDLHCLVMDKKKQNMNILYSFSTGPWNKLITRKVCHRLSVLPVLG